MSRRRNSNPIYRLAAVVAALASTAAGQPGTAGTRHKPKPPPGGADGPIPLFSEVPYIFASNPAVFRDVFARARTQTVRLLYLGDSQEWTPIGGGAVYVPRLSLDLWLRYGNCPETPLIAVNSSTGSPADWLNRVTSAAELPPLAGITPTGWLPPNMTAARYGSTAVSYGNLVSLEQDASFVDPGVQAVQSINYLNTSAGVGLQVFATTAPASGDVAWFAKPSAVGEPSYWAPVSQSGTLGLTLSSPALSVVSGSTGPLNFGGNGYMHVDLYGTSESVRTQIIGSRFRSLANPAGVAITSLSMGGYSTVSFLTNHDACGPVLAALGFDAVLVGFGANDAGGGYTPAEFKNNLQSLIQLLRTSMGPNIPVILVCDPYRQYLSQANSDNFDRYAGAEYQIAQSDPAVMLINSRRAMDDIGWRPDMNPYQYLWDGVHYTGLGARAKADAEARLLESYVIWPCYPNCDGGTTAPLLNVNDFSCFLNKFAAGDAYANCDRSTTPPLLNIIDFTCFLNAFAAGCS